MKIREGLLITVKDERGGQTFGLDSQFAKDLIKHHGSQGTYSCAIGGGLTIHLSTYTDHRSRFAIWKHNYLTWLYNRQLQKALRRQSTHGNSTIANSNTRSMSMYSSEPTSSQKLPESTTKPVAGSRDGNTSSDALFELPRKCGACGLNAFVNGKCEICDFGEP